MDKAKFNVWDDMSGNIAKFWNAATPSKSLWHSQNEIIHESPASYIREFTDSTGRARTDADGPITMIIPAQAGNGGTHADLDAGRSIVESIMAVRKGRVLCMDHRHVTEDRRNEDIDSLIEEQARCISAITDHPIHIISLCSSGYISAMLAATYPEKVLTLTAVASPIDFHVGGGYIYEKLKECGSRPTRMAIDLHGGIMPGHLQRFNWMMMDPYQFFIKRYLDIGTEVIHGKSDALHDRKKFDDWYFDWQDMAGAANIEIVEDLFIGNKLVKGEMEYQCRQIKLSNITCPLALISGLKDDITPPAQVEALGEHSSSEIINEYKVDKGHGLFVSRGAQATFRQAAIDMDAAISTKPII